MAAHQQHAVLSCEAHIVAMMRKFPDSASVQRWGARASSCRMHDMAHLAAERKLSRAGACEAMIAALVQHSLDASVQEAALSVAVSLVCSSASNGRKMRAAGLCRLVVAAMRAHAAHSGVQKCGADAIMVLAEGTRRFGATAAHGAERVAIKDELMAAGVSTALLRALQTHRLNPRTVCSVLCAVTSLAPVFTRRDALKFSTTGGARALVAVMKSHVFDGSVQQASAQVLMDLANKDDTNAISMQFVAAGAGAALTTAIRLVHRYHQGPLDAVACLAWCGAAAQLAAAGAAEAVLAALCASTRSHTAANMYLKQWSAPRLTSALTALCTLADGDKGVCTRLRDAGACEALVLALKSLELPEDWADPNARAYFFGLSSIESLAKICSPVDPLGFAHLARAGACEIVVSTLREILQQPAEDELVMDTIERAIGAMINLSVDHGLAARLGVAGARSAIASTIAIYPDHDLLQMMCNKVKDNLLSTATSRSQRYY
eukprot:TRINITY_DN9746_c0_g1_i1.p1 TRINITY_DN9746_c0_g1~~TRINITY_DN9746_c0_g1_i1.p1  ORF type:complete len:491 (+),score=64.91 TRINITY_DN9746_c0_g1_i1:283-1755(+)